MISAVVLTKNEEKNLERCLRSLQWCSEIIVIDDNSTDKTLEIAQEFRTKIFKKDLNEDFAQQRNFALRQGFDGELSRTAQGEWVLFVDADEEVSRELKDEILRETKEALVNGFYLKRKDYLFGKWLKYGETGNFKILRLGRRGAGLWERGVDEIWKINGLTKTLQTPLLHYPHQTIKEFLESINERSSLNAKVFYSQGKRAGFFEWLKPFLKFIQNYFFKLGFLDGIQGFLLAVLMSFHSFLVRGKLFLLWKKEGGWK